MAANAELMPVCERGWRIGFANVLRKENGAWWRTSAWLVQCVIWLAILNGILATILWAVPSDPAEEAAMKAAIQEEMTLEPTAMDRLTEQLPYEGLSIFLIFAGLAVPVGAIIVGQDAIIGEKQSGTAAWVLSKPVSRSAFILSKLIAHSLTLLVTGVLLQGAVAYAQITAAVGRLSLAGFLAALGLVFLNLLFYLTLTLMLGTFFQGRGGVLGISLGLLFGCQILMGLARPLAAIMPWAMVIPVDQSGVPTTLALALGMPVASFTPIIATTIWCVVFMVVALWRFGWEEF